MHRPLDVLSLACLLCACTAVRNGGEEGTGRAATAAAGAAEPRLAQYPGAPFEDRHGNLWFTTVGEGLIRHDGERLVTFTTEDGLGADTARDILEDGDGTLWIATTGGVSTYDGSSFTTLVDYGDFPATYSFTEQGNHRDVWDLHVDRNGTLWIATLDGVFRREGATFVPFPLPVVAAAGAFEFTPRMVYCIFEDRDGALWFGTDGAGAVRWDGNDAVVYTAREHGLCSDRVSTILRDRRGDLWFGTSDGGVSRHDGTSFTTHLRSAERSPHTGWGRCLAILEDRTGAVWFGVAARGGGAWRWDGTTFRRFSERDGLGTGAIPSLAEDRGGDVWFGTTDGVYRYDGERFVHFGKDG